MILLFGLEFSQFKLEVTSQPLALDAQDDFSEARSPFCAMPSSGHVRLSTKPSNNHHDRTAPIVNPIAHTGLFERTILLIEINCILSLDARLF